MYLQFEIQITMLFVQIKFDPGQIKLNTRLFLSRNL